MTVDEFIKLSDREKDALVAEEIFNLKLGTQTGQTNWNIVPHYSTDMNCALDVIKKLQSEGLLLRITAYKDGTYSCLTSRDNNYYVGDTNYYVKENTLNLVILLGALKTKGVIE